ncbi:MAG TPA: hypothetical protein VGX16_04495 [Solirubrobacteraceae bacterium]|nr:hypothetical protein [Solirubrobacteraceae bacterium]
MAAHPVAVDAQREAGVGVAELVHDGAGIDAEGDEDRGEGVAELVRGQTLRERYILGVGEAFVRALDGSGEGAVADVARVQRPAAVGAEDEVVGAGFLARGLVSGERGVQDGEEVDAPGARVGLPGPHGDVLRGEVDVLPAQVDQLADAQPGEDEGAQDHAAGELAVHSRLPV